MVFAKGIVSPSFLNKEINIEITNASMASKGKQREQKIQQISCLYSRDLHHTEKN